MIHQHPTGGLWQNLVSTPISSLNENPKRLLVSPEQHTDFGIGQAIDFQTIPKKNKC